MKKLRRFFGLSLVEKGVFCRAFFLGWYYHNILKTKRFHDILQGVLKKGESTFRKSEQRVAPEKIAWLIDRAGSSVVSITCLPQALAGYRIYAENGYLTEFHMGVWKKDDEGLEAHAWLTLGGNVVVGALPNLEEYEELSLFSGGAFQ